MTDNVVYIGERDKPPTYINLMAFEEKGRRTYTFEDPEIPGRKISITMFDQKKPPTTVPGWVWLIVGVILGMTFF